MLQDKAHLVCVTLLLVRSLSVVLNPKHENYMVDRTEEEPT